MKTTTKITITYTDGKFEKSLEALTMDEAVSIAKNSKYWPIEISNYSEMNTIITNGEKEIVLTYQDLIN